MPIQTRPELVLLQRRVALQTELGGIAAAAAHAEVRRAAIVAEMVTLENLQGMFAADASSDAQPDATPQPEQPAETPAAPPPPPSDQPAPVMPKDPPVEAPAAPAAPQQAAGKRRGRPPGKTKTGRKPGRPRKDANPAVVAAKDAVAATQQRKPGRPRKASASTVMPPDAAAIDDAASRGAAVQRDVTL